MLKPYNSLILSMLLILFVTMVVGCSSEEKTKTESEQKDSINETEVIEESIPITNLTIQAPMGISIAAPIYKVLEDNELHNLVDEVTFLPWKNPDELRSRISSGQAQVSAVPTNVAANLYNKGMDVQLINTLVWGILYMIGPDGEEISFEELKGKTIHVPFRGDMPDLVFQYLLQKNNLDMATDINIEYIATPQEVVQLLATGKAEYAILPEHTATLAVAKAKKEGQNLKKIISLQAEWAKVTGKEPRIPQAGIIVTGELIRDYPEVVEELQIQLAESVRYLNEQPAEGAELLAKYQDGLDAAFIEKLIPTINLHFASAKDAREELEFFFTELSTISPDIIGGKLPDEGFYYQK